MRKLIKLKNDEWVRAGNITRIRAVKGWLGRGGIQEPPRVVVDYEASKVIHLCETFDEACETRDRWAAEVNDATEAQT